MGERTQAAAGCLTALAGAGTGLALWAFHARGRFRRFEQAPDWSVLYAELPLLVLGGVAAALGVWALARAVTLRRSGS